ncbi:response regulator transcription factor [Undibacterium sp. Ji49W]|uniref:response regulator transcription factor n=1 Tax=Undibacterium sp. Ji49W TaxID=3413040 RepID=UPI003BF3AB20
MSLSTRVFIVDDQESILKALSRLITSMGLEVETFNSAQDFLTSGNAATPGCLILDLSMPGMTGMMLQELLVKEASDMPIIFLTGNGSIDSGVQAMKNGAHDFLTKPVDGDKLLAAIQTALARNQQARQVRAERDAISTRLAGLTPREHEVLLHMAEGKLNKQIAGNMGIAEKTIKIHRARVMTKMEAKSIPALIYQLERLKI